MEISKAQVLGFLFFLVNCFSTFARPATTKSRDDRLCELNASIYQLQDTSYHTWTAMDWVRKNKGYPGRSYNQCGLPTSLLYKSSAYQFYNATTMDQHLKKIKNTLRPLFDATFCTNFYNDQGKNISSKKLRVALTNLMAEIVTPLTVLSYMGYKGHGNIQPDCSKLTKYVKKYMNCAKIPITNKAENFLLYATFIDAVDIAVNDLAGDVSFINSYLSKKYVCAK